MVVFPDFWVLSYRRPTEGALTTNLLSCSLSGASRSCYWPLHVRQSNLGVLGIIGAAVASAILSFFGVHLGGWIGYLIAGFIGAVNRHGRFCRQRLDKSQPSEQATIIICEHATPCQ